MGYPDIPEETEGIGVRIKGVQDSSGQKTDARSQMSDKDRHQESGIIRTLESLNLFKLSYVSEVN